MNTSRVQLEPHESQVRLARQHLVAACRGMPRDVLEVALLLASELVTNAIRHGKGMVQLVVKKLSGRLCVEVSDEGTGRPAPRNPGSNLPGGRGLLLVERLASEWGVAPSRGGGKTVWFTLRSA